MTIATGSSRLRLYCGLGSSGSLELTIFLGLVVVGSVDLAGLSYWLWYLAGQVVTEAVYWKKFWRVVGRVSGAASE